MTYKKIENSIKDFYLGYSILSERVCTYKDDKKIDTIVYWSIYYDGKFLLQDIRNFNGDYLQSCKQAIKDAKSNIDTLIELGKWTIKK